MELIAYDFTRHLYHIPKSFTSFDPLIWLNLFPSLAQNDFNRQRFYDIVKGKQGSFIFKVGGLLLYFLTVSGSKKLACSLTVRTGDMTWNNVTELTMWLFQSLITKSVSTTCDSERTKGAVGTLHKLSYHHQVSMAIFKSGGIPASVTLSLHFYAITSFHNFLFYPDGSKTEVMWFEFYRLSAVISSEILFLCNVFPLSATLYFSGTLKIWKKLFTFFDKKIVLQIRCFYVPIEHISYFISRTVCRLVNCVDNNEFSLDQITFM